MAPRLAMRAETVASLRFSSPVMGGVGSVAPVVIMVLLLLLCFPFRRKKRQLSTRILKKNSASSELLSITKLEDGQSLQEKPLEDGTLHKGSSLPHNPIESQTNGCVVHHLPTKSLPYPDTISPNHQKTEKFEVTDLEHSIILGSQTSCPNSTIPGPLQLRKLPMTPREEGISRTEPLNPSMDSRVYESIKGGERKLCSQDSSKGWEGSDSPSGTSSCAQLESAKSGGEENRTAELMGRHPSPGGASAQVTPTLECNESHLHLQELTSEQDAPMESTPDVEKKLRAMYARVCKKPKTDQQFHPANHNRPMEEGEEEPPPIPEKHFDVIYESIDLETQGSEMPSVITPPDA